jgi:hypothetical protein
MYTCLPEAVTIGEIMFSPNIEKAAEVCSSFALERFGERLTVPEVKGVIDDVLFGSRALWTGS